MHALVRFSHIAAGNSFTTTEIHPAVIKALGCAPQGNRVKKSVTNR
jgi:hypothetical protein